MKQYSDHYEQYPTYVSLHYIRKHLRTGTPFPKFCIFFSSTEPKAPGELIGWEGSVVRRRRPSTISNDFSSETTGPMVTKFHM